MYEVPIFAIDVPMQQNEDNVQYVADQLRKLKEFIEECTGKKITDEALTERLRRSKRTLEKFAQYEKESADKQKQTYQKEVRYLNQAFTEGCENFLHSITADTTLEYPWIKEHVDYENKSRVSLTKAVAEEADAKSRYETMREEVDNLDELLTLAKREIQKSNSCTCPVCKSKFSNKDELLGKIDLSGQRTILLKLKTEWGNACLLYTSDAADE